MIDIILEADAVLDVNVVVDRSEDILFGDVLRDQLVNVALDLLLELLLVGELIEQSLKLGIVNSLVDAQLRKNLIGALERNMCSNIYHSVGENLDVALLGLNGNGENTRILDLVSQLVVNPAACRRNDLTGIGIDHVLGKNEAYDTVMHVELLVELVTSDLGQIVTSRVKEHAVEQ